MPESSESSNVPAQPARPAVPGASPSPPVPPEGTTAADDGRTGLARLVGALLLLAPLLLIYLLIALWPRPQGSIQCEPANQESQGPESQGGTSPEAAPTPSADSGAAPSTAVAGAAEGTRPAGTLGIPEETPSPGGSAGNPPETDMARLEKKIDDLQARLGQEEERKEQWASCATIRPFKREFHLSADIRILILVLLVGALGAYVHASQSYATYIGNRKFKNQWTWWYILRIPIGAALALFVYFTARGGLLTGTTPPSRTDDLNIFGIMSFAALAGLFSKQVVDKLSEVVSNLFSSEQDENREDKATAKKDQTQAGGAGAASGAGTTTGGAATGATTGAGTATGTT